MLHHPADRRNSVLRANLHKNFRHDPPSTEEPFVRTPYVGKLLNRKSDQGHEGETAGDVYGTPPRSTRTAPRRSQRVPDSPTQG
ncbi:hypothetical protein STRIP9103_00685 [Streptomyces ipomoeae 91-03]|uniref:Uncharacterized protein n=1 Tax=Streptomyces ipomoeae 91-03 TaxID=698759 RepID=L1KKV8_9ACTN|nr:hypothetical protein STRIP9103_00685 [Streptomyces ipomoeae 91-03]